jgi:hypothetical protein
MRNLNFLSPNVKGPSDGGRLDGQDTNSMWGRYKVKVKVKVKFILEQPTKAQRGSIDIALLFP